MYIYIALTYAISTLHVLLALISILLGIVSQSRKVVWMAHSVSPIWSGVFVSSENRTKGMKSSVHVSSLQFALCGGTGFVSARQKGLYVVRTVLKHAPDLIQEDV